MSTGGVRTSNLTIMVQRHAKVSLLHLTGQGQDLTKHFFVESALNRNGEQLLHCLLIFKCGVEMTITQTHCATF